MKSNFEQNVDPFPNHYKIFIHAFIAHVPTKKILIESERKNQVGRKLEKKVGTFCYILMFIIFSIIYSLNLKNEKISNFFVQVVPESFNKLNVVKFKVK